MPKVEQIDWSKFGYMPKVKPIKTYKVKKVKRTRAEIMAIQDYYETVNKIRDIIT